MAQLGHCLRFALQARARLRQIGQMRVQDFDRHLAIERAIVPAVHHGHAAAADLFDEAVAIEVALDHDPRLSSTLFPAIATGQA